ncbi:MAG: OstA-like protein [Bacteroidota bacterium]|nr:OstA-like protein [Bacteroidota bacterium]
MKRAFLIGWALLFICTSARAQKTIRILNSDYLEIKKQKNGSRIYYLQGNVGLQQDVAVMTSDSAILIQPLNEFKAFGNVKIVQADTTVISGERLDYKGETRTFTIKDNVNLITPNSKLSTQVLFYDRVTANAYYTTRSTLYRNQLELTADIGTYNTRYETVRLRGSVEAIDSAYTLFTDTLIYYPSMDSYDFAGPSTLLKDSTTIQCQVGRYEANLSQLYLGNGAKIASPKSLIRADSISYNLNDESGELFNKALVADTAQGLVLESDYIDYVKQPNYVNAYTPVYYRQRMNQDTLYAIGDTLKIREDSTNFHSINLLYNTRFFSTDFQGNSQFFNYNEKTDLLTLFPKPLMWSKKSQFACDTAMMTLRDEKLDSLFLIGNAAVISQSKDSLFYDQAICKRLDGNFLNNAIHTLRLEGNAENISHSINADSQIEGISKSTCSWIEIQFKDGEANKVKAGPGGEASYVPWSSAKEEIKRLPGCTPAFDLKTTKAETRPKINQ